MKRTIAIVTLLFALSLLAVAHGKIGRCTWKRKARDGHGHEHFREFYYG